jgi:hypothetical protein
LAGEKLAVSTVSLSGLCSDPKRFSFSCPTAREAEELTTSLGRFGLLRPFLAVSEVEVNEEGRVLVAAGARRLGLLGSDSVLEVAVHTVVSAELPELWDLLLEDHLLSGEPNIVEVGLYIKKRMADTGETLEELADRVFARLGLTPRAQAAAEPLWIAALPPAQRQRFAEEELPSKGLKTLTSAPAGDALAVLKLTESLKLGRNKFMELARWVMECAWRDGVDVAQWLTSLEGSAEFAAFTEKSMAELTGEELRQLLWQLRYPTLSEWSAEFETVRRKLGLGKNSTLAHSPGFEGGKLRLSINFATLGELKEELDLVNEKGCKGELQDLEKFLS